MFYLRTTLRATAREIASRIALRDCSKEVKEETGCIGVFAGKKKKKTHIVGHLKITANHKKSRHLQVMI